MPTSDESVQLTKSGEEMIDIAIRRDYDGLKVIARTHPCVENLIKSWSAGRTTAVKAFGRSWDSAADPFAVWNLDESITQRKLNGALNYSPHDKDTNFEYRLDVPGSPFLGEANRINASLLRIVGISKGVEFKVEDIISTVAIRNYLDKVKLVSKKLYTDYLLPLEFRVRISTEERRLK